MLSFPQGRPLRRVDRPSYCKHAHACYKPLAEGAILPRGVAVLAIFISYVLSLSNHSLSLISYLLSFIFFRLRLCPAASSLSLRFACSPLLKRKRRCLTPLHAPNTALTMLPSPHLFPFRLLQLDAMDAFLIAPRPTSLLPRQQQQNWRVVVSKAFDTAAQIHSESLTRTIPDGASARARRHTHTRLEDDGPGADPYVPLSSSITRSQASSSIARFQAAQRVIETTRLLSISP